MIVNSQKKIDFFKKYFNKKKYVCVDTEFERKKTYFSKLSIITISDGKKFFIFDILENPEIIEIIRDLRLGHFDVLVGINLLREGLDIPECSLVAILDADKEGFLRSETSLVQTIGRAARNIEGKVILYADKKTKSIVKAIQETDRRRAKQEEYNKKNNISAVSIKKEIGDILENVYEKDYLNTDKFTKPGHNLKKHMKALKKDMQGAADNLEFEQAAKIRDEIRKLEHSDMGLTVNSFTKSYNAKNTARSTQGRAGTKSGKRYQKK